MLWLITILLLLSGAAEARWCGQKTVDRETCRYYPKTAGCH
jgi:hypothetical protein